MANIAHASLTGDELHEPKGVDTATSGTVYVADGAGSGVWQAVGASALTGMIADFIAPVAPSGWLELDGSTVSTTTYSSLFSVIALSVTGTRTSGSPVVTSISSTSNFKVGYYVFGAGIASGTTIVSVDSATQITMSNNASASGAVTFYVSPWLLNTGTMTLPNMTAAGRFRRSRTSSTKPGDVQADQNQTHTHSLSVSGTTSSDGSHTHTATSTVTDPGHTHTITNDTSVHYTTLSGGLDSFASSGSASFGTDPNLLASSATTGVTVATTTASSGAHTHTVTSTGTSGSSGSTEARPLAMICITCVKT